MRSREAGDAWSNERRVFGEVLGDFLSFIHNRSQEY